MTRETKVGLIVAGSFICLVGIVVVSKIGRGTTPPEENSAPPNRIASVDQGPKNPPEPAKKEPAPAPAPKETKPADPINALLNQIDNDNRTPLPAVPLPKGDAIAPLPLPKGDAIAPLPLPKGDALTPLPLPNGDAFAPLPVPKGDALAPAPTAPANFAPLPVPPETPRPNANEGAPAVEIKGIAAVAADPTPAPVKKDNLAPPPAKKDDIVPAPIPAAFPPLDGKKQPGDPVPAPNFGVKPTPVGGVSPIDPPNFSPMNPATISAPMPPIGVAIPDNPVIPPPAPKKQLPMTTEPLTGPAAKSTEPIPMIPPPTNPFKPEPPVSVPAPPVIPKEPVNSPTITAPITVGGIAPAVSMTQSERTEIKPGETNFAALSKRLYNDEKYAQALHAYNRDHHLAVVNGQNLTRVPPVLAPGQQVIHPPLGVLERDYRALIAITEPPPTVPVVNVTSPVRLSPPSIPPVTTAIAPVSIGTPGRTRPYIVQNPAGERLRDIAERLLGNPDLWPQIYRLNNWQPQFPIPAGTELKIPAN